MTVRESVLKDAHTFSAQKAFRDLFGMPANIIQYSPFDFPASLVSIYNCLGLGYLGQQFNYI